MYLVEILSRSWDTTKVARVLHAFVNAHISFVSLALHWANWLPLPEEVYITVVSSSETLRSLSVSEFPFDDFFVTYAS